MPDLSTSEAFQVWKDHEKQLAAGTLSPSLRIGITASFTIDSFVPFLGANLIKQGVLPKIATAPYNQVFQTLQNPEVAFGNQVPDVVQILWRIEDLLQEPLSDFCLEDLSAWERAEGILQALSAAIVRFRKKYSSVVVISLPPHPTIPQTDLKDLLNPVHAGAFHRKVVSRLTELLTPVGGVYFFDLDSEQRDFGATAAFDPRTWYLARQPFTSRFLARMAVSLTRICLALNRPTKKCVVLDCDNTLWGGIVGEDGIQGLQLGEDFPGSAFRDFQKLLLALWQRGIFLAICSKNNEPDVWEVFDKHDGMILRREHIAAHRINWNPKSGNIREIAKELNIGTDAMVLVEDNPMELAEVTRLEPAPAGFLVPKDLSLLCREFHQQRFFDVLQLSEEDRLRNQSAQSEKVRRQHKEEMSESDFLSSLNIQVEVFVPKEEHFQRVAQLINKTNQFNLTTRRCTQSEVEELASRPGSQVLAMRVFDRFGNYGLVGVAIVKNSFGKTWELDSFLVSCRVLGRKVEDAFLSAVTRYCCDQGAESLLGHYLPTAKNQVAEDFLPKHGFSSHENGWILSLEKPLPVPEYVGLLLLNAPEAENV